MRSSWRGRTGAANAPSDWNRRAGQGLVEYGLILVLVAAPIGVLLLVFGEGLATMFAGFTTLLEALL